jgi:hypothetical protein
MIAATATQIPDRQRARGPKLAVLFGAAEGKPMVEGLAAAKDRKLAVASLISIEKGLADLETYHAIKRACPCRSGDMTVYVMPDKTFREAAERIHSLGNDYFVVSIDTITRRRDLFHIFEEHLDKKNAILVARRTEYSIEPDGNDTIVLPTKVGLLEGFPATDGWYPIDPEYGITYGKKAGNGDLRVGHLKRIGMRVGTADIDHGRYPNADRCNIHLDKPPSAPLGMVTEEP